jgi:hypothetical protein
MATGFGFCPNCGTAMTAAKQVFCASCGANVSAVAAAATIPAPLPAPSVGAPPPPPAWGVPPAPGVPAGAPPYPYAAPVAAAPAKTGISPVMLLIGGAIILAIVGVAIFAINNGAKGGPGASASNNGGYPGSIVFSPASVGCPGESFTTNVRLPATLNGTDQITMQLDGATVGTQAVTDYGLTKQPDGTWYHTSTAPSECSMGAGIHTETLLDSGGHVLAQGSFTLVTSDSSSSASTPTASPRASKTPSKTASPTPAPRPSPTSLSKSTVTVKPSSFSFSGADVQVLLSIQLSAAIPGASQYFTELDGVQANTGTVQDDFVKQTDGSWLSSGNVASSTLCSELGTGQHRLSITDSDGKLIAEATFTLNP